MTSSPLREVDRDRDLSTLLDPVRADQWVREVARSLEVGVALAAADGTLLAAFFPKGADVAAVAEAGLTRVTSRSAAEPAERDDRPDGAFEAEEGAELLWQVTPVGPADAVLGLLLLGATVAPAGGEGCASAERARIKALLPVLRDSLEWVLYAELSRQAASDRHREAVERHRDALAEADVRLREADAQLEALVQDLGRGIQQASEEALRAQREAFARDRQASLGRLASGVAHEINNPLAFVAGNLGAARDYLNDVTPVLRAVQALAEEGTGKPEAAERVAEAAHGVDLAVVLSDFPEVLADAKEGADRVSRIVQALKDFSRVDRADLEELDLSESVRAAARLIEARVPAGVELKVETPQAVLAQVCGGALHQALWNLLENALWAVSQGGRWIRLASGLGPDASEAWLEVEDDGPGVPEACAPLLFDPFFTTKDVGEGAGLGLSVVRDVAHAHGGRVELASEPGRGARFRLVVPALPTHGPKAP
ncbi:MAG: HAMP domain-containing histidine kinase [Deltaproteobacteria bacterium]|nr:HAMP domain-containing histidine kinase [Deltaproteobacteria bacterium]